MATVLVSMVKQYGKAVIRDKTRTLDSVPESYKTPVKEYAAGVYVVGTTSYPSGYTVEDMDEALAAGTLTTEQYAEIMSLNPDIPHRPAPAAISEPSNEPTA